VTVRDGRPLWLIRHAESSWNAHGRWQGWSDPGLSRRGRAQAATLAGELAAAGVGAIVASDLRRARETAEIVGEQLGVALRFDARLRERDLGSWSGLTTPEIAGRWPDALARLRARDPELRPGGGESIRDLQERLRGFFADLAAQPDAVCVALVTHGGVIRALGAALPLANASCTAATLDALRAELGDAP